MDSFYYNKVAGAVLASLLLMVGLRTAIHLFYPKGDENISKGHIVVTTGPLPSQSAGAAKPEEPDPPVESLLASASPDTGQSAMKQCATCHTWTKGGTNKMGPNLYGVVDRDVAKEAGYSYSSALQKKGGKWTFDELYQWIKNPKAFAPGNKMGFGGVKDPKERADIIAYLDKQSDNPAPLPKK